jgi:2-polyprenyl-6-methoxyphenol hydroxylase-like FAD-dependent oxidoreductase
VGAGPVGLSVANLLKAAGLDFVIVERHREVVSKNGGAVMLWPQGTRVWESLGLLDAAQGHYMPTHSRMALDHRGRVIDHLYAFDWLEEK